jgi:hypothetical protein
MCTSGGQFNGYVDATPADRAAVADVVHEYYRARNALAGETSAETLWQTYPSLAKGRDVPSGVNVEPEFVERTRRLGVRVVRTDESAIEPLRVLIRDDAAVAVVHGREEWLLPAGDKTVFEIKTLLYLSRRGSQWVILKTDERELGERDPSLPPPPG